GAFAPAMFSQPDAAEYEHKGSGVVETEVFAKDEYGQERAKDWHEIDEKAGAVAADQFDPAQIECLGDDRGQDGGVDHDHPTAKVRPDRCVHRDFPGCERN